MGEALTLLGTTVCAAVFAFRPNTVSVLTFRHEVNIYAKSYTDRSSLGLTVRFSKEKDERHFHKGSPPSSVSYVAPPDELIHNAFDEFLY